MLHDNIGQTLKNQPAVPLGDLLGSRLHPVDGRSAGAAPGQHTVEFTVIESSTLATKQVELDESGTLVKSGAVKLYAGRAFRRSLSGDASAILAGLADEMRSFGPKNVLVLAPPIEPGGELKLVTKGELDGTPGVIARTKEQFPPVPGPALLALDFDTAEFPAELLEKIRAAGSISEALVSAFPPFAEAACLRRASASSGIRRVGSGASADTGQHRYYVASDGSSIDAFVGLLADRLMLAGFMWGKITDAGWIDVRTLFDVDASKDTSRLFFEADAALGKGLEYAPDSREPHIAPGDVLDITAIKPLSPDERIRLDRRKADLQRALAPEAAAVRQRWQEKRIADLIAKGRSPEAARRAVTSAVERHLLPEDFDIFTDDGASVSIAEILDDRHHFHGMTCADPLEPDYHGGTNLAVIYTDRLPYRIFSHAHGGIDYTLPLRPEDFFDDLGDGEPAGADGAPSAGERKAGNASLELVSFAAAAASALSRSAKPLIKGLLDQGALSVLYGESNVGKTFVAMDMAFHIAAGMEWAGCRTTQKGVVYVAAEGGLGASRRALALQKRYGDVAADVPFHFRLAAVDLRRPDADLAALVETVNACGDVGLVVIDTLSRALAGGDENSSVDLGGLVKNVDRLRLATKAHVMLVHHSGKERARGARGHSLLRAATDTEIEIADHEIAVTKQRDMDGNFRRAFLLEPVALGKDAEGDPVTSCIVRLISRSEKPAAKPTPVEDEVLTALRNLHEDNVSVQWFKPEEIAAACSTGDKFMQVETVRTRLRSMEKKHLVERKNRGLWAEKTDSMSGGIEPTVWFDALD